MAVIRPSPMCRPGRDEQQRICAADHLGADRDLTELGCDESALGLGDELDGDLALDRLDVPDQDVRGLVPDVVPAFAAAERKSVGQPQHTTISPEIGLHDHRLVDVLTSDLVATRGADRPVPTRVEQAREHARRVEPGR